MDRIWEAQAPDHLGLPSKDRAGVMGLLIETIFSLGSYIHQNASVIVQLVRLGIQFKIKNSKNNWGL